jgi:hypothetical protein
MGSVSEGMIVNHALAIVGLDCEGFESDGGRIVM